MSFFQPHGVCLQWSPELLIPTILGDGLTALAYFVMPIALWLWARKQKGDPFRPFRRIVQLFGAFIILCGISHVFDILLIYYPLYYLSAYERLIMAFVSLFTAGALLKLGKTRTRCYDVKGKVAVDLELPVT